VIKISISAGVRKKENIGDGPQLSASRSRLLRRVHFA